jgi:phi13 family phage major tail protein
MPNKIKYGLKNVYYAVATIAANGSATYTAPKALPGAVSISLDPQGDTTPFYADNVAYWTGIANTGYEGDLEVAMLSDDFYKDVLGNLEDKVGVLYETNNASPIHFALMFQFEGDVEATRHIFYNCTAARPNIGSETQGETVEPGTETVTLTANSIYVPDLDKDVIKAKATNSESPTAYASWFTQPYIPVAVS